MTPGCPLCDAPGGHLVFSGPALRVVRAAEPGFPAFYRVVWNSHVAEFSELSHAQRAHCMEAVVQVELALREYLQPDKINLAALGNMVPHLHWHVIARFAADSHFPAPVWAAAVRSPSPSALAAIEARLAAMDLDIENRLRALAA